jgi:hypothetical protein
MALGRRMNLVPCAPRKRGKEKEKKKHTYRHEDKILMVTTQTVVVTSPHFELCHNFMKRMMSP